MSLRDKILEASTIKQTSVLSESILYEKDDIVETSIPALNVALYGRLDGGLTPGITIFAGESKRFKSLFTIFLAKAYLDQYEDSVLLFYDSEFGTPKTYWARLNIDPERVVHSPILNTEQLKFDMMKQLSGLTRNERVIIAVDSLGNLASKKEVEDALEEKSVADMSRAKGVKSLFRSITPYFKLLNIPMIMVNHIYMSMGMYPTAIVSGGQGPYLSADNIYIVGKQQVKEGTELVGNKFILNVEKSRFVKEKSKIPIEVSFDEFIEKYSGLLDMALESGHVIKPKQGWYQKVGKEGNYREKDTYTDEFWKPILSDKTFQDFVQNKYALIGTQDA